MSKDLSTYLDQLRVSRERSFNKLHDFYDFRKEERREIITKIAQAALGLDTIEDHSKDKGVRLLTDKLDLFASASGDAYFEELRLRGVVKYSDISEDGTLNINSILKRLGATQTPFTQLDLEFLRSYSESRTTKEPGFARSSALQLAGHLQPNSSVPEPAFDRFAPVILVEVDYAEIPKQVDSNTIEIYNNDGAYIGRERKGFLGEGWTRIDFNE